MAQSFDVKDNRQLIARRKRMDRLAALFIKTGGIAVIASVMAILILILKVTLPLYQPPTAEQAASFALTGDGGTAKVLALGIDEYLKYGYVITTDRTEEVSRAPGKAQERPTDRMEEVSRAPGKAQERAVGQILFFNLTDGRIVATQSIAGTTSTGGVKAVTMIEPDLALVLEGSGAKRALRIRTGSSGSLQVGEQDAFHAAIEEIAAATAEIEDSEALKVTGQFGDGRAIFTTLYADNRLALTRQTPKESLLGDVSLAEEQFLITPDFPGRITAIAMTRGGDTLFAGTDTGAIAQWRLDGDDGPHLVEVIPAFRDRAITAMAMVFGSASLAVGDATGELTTWMKVRTEEGKETRKLRLIHTLTRHEKELAAISPSLRDKSLASLDSAGVLHVDHMTSERHLYTFALPGGIEYFSLAPRNNGLAALGRDGRLTLWRLHNPHPEVSFKTLFGKVWYEGYDAPAYVWQSSAANDDNESKLSIVPLFFGTLKGTFYAMLFAIPLAIFGAVYVSQFATPRLRQTVKPMVEIMASLPSVVIGFLIALWLAPIVEKWLVSLFLFLAFLPLCFVVFMTAWRAGNRFDAIRFFPKGYEFLLLTPVLLLAAAAAWSLGPPLELALFGDFKLWLYEKMGVRYDMRNCLIIAFGLGFCVIPIIFSITEDALSNIPFNLTAASFALGASRWQTVWRVILPSASPGIFAAIMIGFGRAVGETMVVLMATGNTPILDWTIFNGMRTLSANIAVEIPEAPLGSTLYRVLFLCAVILFVLTFLLNTSAELVRDHLRKKYVRY